MKKIIYILMLFAATALTSCSKDKEEGTSGEISPVTIQLSTIEPATRTLNITRYIMEVYKTADLNTRIARVEQASSTIVVNLETNINYTCLFWADEVTLNDNSTGTYNALDLKNVTLNSGKIMQEAFFAKYEITTNSPSFGVTLSRATAKVNFKETGTVAASKNLEITFDQHPGFNALTSNVIGAATSITRIFNSAATSGTLGTLLTFASVTGVNTDFTAVFDATVTNTMLNTPLKANYITNLLGNFATGNQDFSLIITVDGTWESVISGVHVNFGTSGTPNWVIIADRNALKGGTDGATPGNTNTAADYGYYYAASNASNDPTNVEKAYRACFDFGEGNGVWRLPTGDELKLLVGNAGYTHNVNADRKAKWNFTAGSGWQIFDERAGQTANFVNIPLAGYNSAGSGTAGDTGVAADAYLKSSTQTGSGTWHFARLKNDGNTYTDPDSGTDGATVRCVRNAE